mmetsp:Transcript_31716/g.83379  ORF Transcript_31716/g.83379 Transcript_31716/m.83379 type:complete len:218 (+) Transcript_31716:525-1178(+)
MSVTRQAPRALGPEPGPSDGQAPESVARPRSQSQKDAPAPLTRMLWEFTSRCHASAASCSSVGPSCNSNVRAKMHPRSNCRVHRTCCSPAFSGAAIAAAARFAAASASRNNQWSSCSPGKMSMTLRTLQPSSQRVTACAKHRGRRRAQDEGACLRKARSKSISKTVCCKAVRLLQCTSFSATMVWLLSWRLSPSERPADWLLPGSGAFSTAALQTML